MTDEHVTSMHQEDQYEGFTPKRVDKYLATLPTGRRFKWVFVYFGDVWVECFNDLQRRLFKGVYSRWVSRVVAIVLPLAVIGVMIFNCPVG